MKLRKQLSELLYTAWHLTELPVTRRVVLVVATISVLFTGLPVALNTAGNVAYRSNNYQLAQQLWRLNQRVAWHDTDIPHANAGAAYYRLTNWTPAVDQLESALKLAPTERTCRVRWNLALSLDQRATVHITGQQLNAAVGDYTRAVNVLNFAICTDDQAYKDDFIALQATLNKKLETVITQINEQHKRPSSTQDTDPNQKPETDQQEKAEEEARKTEMYNYQSHTGRYNDQTAEEKAQGYQTKPW